MSRPACRDAKRRRKLPVQLLLQRFLCPFLRADFFAMSDEMGNMKDLANV